MRKSSSFSLMPLFSGLRSVCCVLVGAFALVLLAAACGDDGTGPEGPTLTGTWTDTIQEVDGNTFDFQLRRPSRDRRSAAATRLRLGSLSTADR